MYEMSVQKLPWVKHWRSAMQTMWWVMGWIAAMGSALSRYDFVACRMDTLKLNRTWVQKIHGNPQEHGLNVYRNPPYFPHVVCGSLAGGSGV